MKTINYTTTSEFDKDKKALLKKYKSIDSDLQLFITFAAELYHIQGIDSNSIIPIPGFENEQFQLYKVVKFPCKALKNRGAKSGIRLIYAFYETENSLEFVQMYFKADDENMDYERAKEYLKEILSLF